MAMGNYKASDYLRKLYEGVNVDKIESKDGLVIPEENKKAYDWLKKEYTSAQEAVKVEMKVGNEKFNPGFEMQADIKSTGKEFKPGMFGNSVPKTVHDGTKSDFKPNNFGGSTSKEESSTDDSSDNDNQKDTDSENYNEINAKEKYDKKKDTVIKVNNSKK